MTGGRLTAAIATGAVLFAAGVAPAAQVAPGEREVTSRFSPKTFTADESGTVRLIVRYRTPAGAPRAVELARAARGELRRRFSLIPADALSVPEAGLDDALGALQADPEVLSVEPDRRSLRVFGQSLPWGINRIDAEVVHTFQTTGQGVRVAVLDTGIDRNHPDLKKNYKGGYDFVHNDSVPGDDHGHGTHVAGTIAAVDNSLGVVGAAPDVSLYALKVIAGDGWGQDSDLIAGLNWAVNNNIDVVNFSAGGYYHNQLVEDACQAAYDAGVLIVAAAGNDPSYPVAYPAAYSSVIAVGAATKGNKRAWFSAKGPKLELAAPGVGILSTIVGGGYAKWDGTSMATPHVAGAAALVISSGVTGPANVRAALRAAARDLGPAGRDEKYGFGLVDAAAAIPYTSFLVDPVGGEIVPAGQVYTITWTAPPNAVSYVIKYSLNNGRKWHDIAPGEMITGTSRDWLAPTPLKTQKDARLKITAWDAADTLAGRNRSRKFTVQVLRIDTPAGGETVTSGADYNVTWTTHATARPVAKTVIALSKNGGRSWKKLGEVPGDPGGWLWSPVAAVKKVQTDAVLRVTFKDAGGEKVGRAKRTFTLHP